MHIFSKYYPTKQEAVKQLKAYPTKQSWGWICYVPTNGKPFSFISRGKFTRWVFYTSPEATAAYKRIKSLRRTHLDGVFDMPHWSVFDNYTDKPYAIGERSYDRWSLIRLAPLFTKACVLDSGELFLFGDGVWGILAPEE